MEEKSPGEPELIEGIDDDDDLDAGPPEGTYRPHDFVDRLMAAMEAKKPVREFPKLFRQAFDVVWEADRVRFVIVTVLGLITGTGLGFQLLAGRDAFAAVLAAEASGEGLRAALPQVATVAVLSALLGVITQARTLQQDLLTTKVSRASQNRILDAATLVELRRFEEPDFFDHLQRARDASQVGVFQTVGGLMGVLSNSASMIAVSGALLAIQPLLLPLVMAGAVPLVLIGRRVTRKTYGFRLWRTPGERERNYLTQLLTGKDEAKEVRAFNLRPHLRARYDRLYDEYFVEYRKLARTRMSAGFQSSAATQGAVVITFGALLGFLFAGRITIAGAAAAGIAVQQLSTRVQGLAQNFSSLYESAVFLGDWSTFLALEPEGLGRSAAAPEGFERMSAHNLTFTYPGAQRPALRDVSLEINRGEVIALVGENGSGKTTLAKLLCHLYGPDSGRILWNGVDTATMSPAALRDSIAAIFQDFARYQLPARDNVGMGRSERIDDLDAIRAAATHTGADRFLSRLPSGYDTPLSKAFDGGKDLSVGQWQRVALARAFFRDADFVVLDEPTASLDPRAEHALFESIRSLCAGKSVLLISHRFSSVRSADRIYVLDKGRVIEAGDHRDLMEKNGLYAELFTLQAAAYVD